MAERLVRTDSPDSPNRNGVSSAPTRTVNFVSCINSPVKDTDMETLKLEDFINPNGKSETPAIQRVCANPSCETQSDLVRAPNYVCAYYEVSEKKRKVCLSCLKEAQQHQDNLVNLVRQGKCVFLGPKLQHNNASSTVDLEDDEINDRDGKSCEEVEIDIDETAFLQKMMKKHHFTDQVESSVKHLGNKWSSVKVKMSELDQLQSDLERNLNVLRKELYDGHETHYQHLDPIEIDAEGNASKICEAVPEAVIPIAENQRLKQLPPPGIFTYPTIKLNQAIFALRSSLLSPWGKGRVIKVKNENELVIRFDGGGTKPRVITRKNLAYPEPSPVQLTVGARVIAQYIEDKGDGKPRPALFYAGIIAEPPKYLNEYRYLVFFDDGYAQYCTHEQVLVVCNSSKDVWQDIHLNTRSFIMNYLQQFPERAMVKLQKGQTVKTELNGRWLLGRVDLVDASLAKIFFIPDGRHEWIYRGSTRLWPLYELMANAEARKNQGATRPAHNLSNIHKKKNAPYVEYTRGLDTEPPKLPLAPPQPAVPSSAAASPSTQNVVRAVARKSTNKPPSQPIRPAANPPTPPPRLESQDPYISAEHKGILKQQKNDSYEEVPFEPHQCGKKCVERFPFQEGDLKENNPLFIPMRLGWSREMSKQRLGSKRFIEYRAPCGRRMRNMDEVHRYLRLTGCQLGVDLFSFDHCVHCFTEFEPEVIYSRLNDITGGKEHVKISCINSIDRSNPEYIEYSTARTPREGVKLNLDPGFLSCCDCTDDCQDKEKCQCSQLTIQATSSTPSGKIDHNAGYQYRRLTQHYTTGIYECNDGCSCRKTCLNRVAQRPMQLRLQAFKTEKRGWGIRCLDDIPRGGFICVYAGQLLTDQEANEDGKEAGDEYLAELDLIEVVEKGKDGYESDVDIDIDDPSNTSQGSSDGEDSSSSEGGSKDDEASKDSISVPKKPKTPPSSPTPSNARSSEPKIDPTQPSVKEKPEAKVAVRKTRELYGKNEHCYVMDAKSVGNIGRYLNHCCKPNVFVQSVFVDTHDLRFPWVAFFAMNYIRAGTELTWDYNYHIDSVPGRKLYCHCGAKECKGRLL